MNAPMKMSELRLLELDPAIVMKQWGEIVARQLSGNVGELLPTELHAATIAAIVKTMRAHLDRAEGAAVKGLGFLETTEGIAAKSAIITLTNGYGILLPPEPTRHL